MSENQIIVGTLVLIASALGLMTYCETNYEIICIVQDEIVAVGGCTRDGLCGVMTKENGKHERYKPVVGESICLKSERRHK